MAQANLYALPPGVDFPTELVRGLLERYRHRPPEDLARLRLYLNSGRMKRRVEAAFDRFGACLLPQIGLVTDFAALPLPGIPAAVSPLRRRLELARLVTEFIERLPGFEAGAGVFALAESLADLMAEMRIENVSVSALEALDIEATHAEHWRASLRFIQIIARYFEEGAEPDPEGRLRAVVDGLVTLWRSAPPADPILIAGSTGSRGATAALMAAVARLQNGAVVLPGFDFEMSDPIWGSLCSAELPLEDHPQFRFAALCQELGTSPSDMLRWTRAEAPSVARNRLVSLALRPAPVTDQWMTEGQALGDLSGGTRAMTLIEANTPRQEALSIALVLRNALEQGRTAALISPDRTLTRRVSTALGRWGIRPDDSAGEPLNQTAPGRLLRHVALAFGQRVSIETLLILLKHPLTATGSTMRGEHLRLTRELELHLRRHGPAFPSEAALQLWAQKDPSARAEWIAWICQFLAEIEPFSFGQLPECVQRHLDLCALLAAGPGGSVAASELWMGEAGQETLRIMTELSREAGHGGAMGVMDYGDLVGRLLASGMVRHSNITHPQIAIWGTLEARAQGVDLVVLGGLNEGVWPEALPPDPWLSRRMRLEAGLLLPERKIGLAAHDFQQAIAAPETVITRARRDDAAETVPSRWLNRLTNLLAGLPAQGGADALAAMRSRGAVWLALAAKLDVPDAMMPPASRPSPAPPVGVRPRELPVTAIQTLIRDPYALYARRILRLRKLDPIRAEADPRLRGQVLHKIVETFVRERDVDEPPEAAQARLLATAGRILAQEVPFPSAQRLWLARISAMAERFIADEAQRAAIGAPVVIEETGSVTLQNIGFTLTAKPDRVDLLEDGTLQIYDYKSGKIPSQKEVLHFDKQLLLEAGIAARGGFAGLGPRETSGMTYIGLGREAKVQAVDQTKETIEQAWAKFEQLMACYLDPDQRYTARRAMMTSDQTSDYDHLSRFGEWELSDLPEDAQ